MRRLSTRAGLDDPHPIYAELREAGSIHDVPHFGPALTRFSDVHAVLFDRTLKVGSQAAKPGTARANIAAHLPGDLAALPAPLFLQDDPSHKRLRKLVVSSFSLGAVLPLRPFIEKTAAALLCDIGDSGGNKTVDLVANYAAPLPMQVIAHILGVPQTAMSEFRVWSEDIVHELHALASPGERDRAIAAHRALVDFFRAELKERLERPREDFISRLGEAMKTEKTLNEDELVSLCINLLVAGHITTSDLIGILTHLLLTHPEQRSLLERDGALWPQAVDEALRYDPPTPMLARVEACRVRRHDRDLEAGDSVNVFIAAANRDPRRFERAETFDISRDDNPHLSFGGGLHYCLGAQLARTEAEIACRLLFTRFPRIALATDGASWRHTPNFRGLSRLSVTLAAAARGSACLNPSEVVA